MMKELRNEQGFTLVELLLYVGVVVVIISGVTGLAFLMLETRVKTQAMNEVNYQGERIVEIITQTVRNAEGINSPTKQGSSGSLSVDVLDAGDDPTVFDSSGGSVTIQEGGAGTIALSNNHVSVSNLVFSNNGLTDAPDSIQFSFQLNFNNPEGRNEYSYSKTFNGTASVR
ncbi:MAG: prepilin-type N-terminal cleavage/methylation domain-containing protein [Candidatus Moranbacteria bacterium]|nr:prepilin-type N-terminal cleavage/methylation domain-containing protein [Candidatus Moranbacteria bacterium]